MTSYSRFSINRRSDERRRKGRVRPGISVDGMRYDVVLEPRTLLSTIVVSNVNDSGPGSLRAAVAQAANGDAIAFAHHLAGKTITLQSEIAITKNLTISGPAKRDVTLSGGGTTRVLEIDGATVGLANLAITQGSAANGGGILDFESDLSLSHDLFTGNVAAGSTTQTAQGGAIFEQGGNLSIDGSTFTGNRAIGNPQSPESPGPVVVDPIGPILLSPGPIATPDVTIVFKPVTVPSEADGGAIAEQGGTLLIQHSHFTGNSATAGAVQTGTGAPASGGAVFARNASLTSLSSTFQANQAIGGPIANSPGSVGFTLTGGTALGGAIGVDSSSVTLHNSTIRRNTARGGQVDNSDAAMGGVGGEAAGGALSLKNNSSLMAFGGTISRNQALSGTGIAPSPSQPNLVESSGDALGGGIDAEGASSVSIDGTTLAANMARSGDAPMFVAASRPDDSSSAGRAGGGGIDFDSSGTFVLSQAALRNNMAIGGNANVPAQAFGGGVAIQQAAAASILDSVLHGNRAQTGRGFDASVGTSVFTVAASGGGIYASEIPGSLSVLDSRIAANRAVGVGNGVASGGGLSLAGVQANLFGDTLQSNAAIGGSIVINGEAGQAAGGAIFGNGQNLTVSNSTFLDNRATTTKVDQRFEVPFANDASVGGAIANQFGTVRISGGSFVGNSAKGGAGVPGSPGANGQGGAIYSIGIASQQPFMLQSAPVTPTPTSFVTATGVMFKNNSVHGGKGAARSSTAAATAGGNGAGGAIDNEAFSSLDLSSSTVTGNLAQGARGGHGNGGGIFLAPTSVSSLVGNSIVNNRASTSGNNVDDAG